MVAWWRERVSGEKLQRGRGTLKLSGMMGKLLILTMWWCHRYKYMPNLLKVLLNTCSFSYVNCTSMKLLKKNYSTVENSMKGPHKIESRTTIWHCNPILGIYLQDMDSPSWSTFRNTASLLQELQSEHLTPPPRQAALNRIKVTEFLFNNKWNQKKLAIKFKLNNRGLFILYNTF